MSVPYSVVLKLMALTPNIPTAFHHFTNRASSFILRLQRNIIVWLIALLLLKPLSSLVARTIQRKKVAPEALPLQAFWLLAASATRDQLEEPSMPA